MKHEAFLNSVAYFWAFEDESRIMYMSCGVQVQDFPVNSLRGEIIRDYERCREELSSHEAARFEVSEKLQLLINQSKNSVETIPVDPYAFKPLYEKHLQTQLNLQLAEDLKKNPDNAQHLVEQHLQIRRTSSQVLSLSEFDTVLAMNINKPKNERFVQINQFPETSKIIDGFSPGRIGLLLGETGFGKTNLLLNFALSARHTLPTLYFNMEMNHEDIGRRFAVILSGLTYKDYRENPKKFLTPSLIEKYKEGDLFITNGKALTLGEIQARIKEEVKKENPIRFVIIDYDQKIELPYEKTTPEWKQMQNAFLSLEELAKETRTYILIAGQVNRDGQISSSHRATYPMHTILKFYDHEYYGPIIETIKNRHGRNYDAVCVEYNRENSRIREKDVVNTQFDKVKQFESNQKKKSENKSKVIKFLERDM